MRQLLKNLFNWWIELNVYVRGFIITLIVSFLIREKEIHFLQGFIYQFFNVDVILTSVLDHFFCRLFISFSLIFIISVLKTIIKPIKREGYSDELSLYRRKFHELILLKNTYYKIVTYSLLSSICVRFCVLEYSESTDFLYSVINLTPSFFFILFLINLFRISKHEVNSVYDKTFKIVTIDNEEPIDTNSYYKWLILNYFRKKV